MKFSSRPAFTDAARQFSDFLMTQNVSSELLWLTRDRISQNRKTWWIFRPHDLSGSDASKLFYEALVESESSIRIDGYPIKQMVLGKASDMTTGVAYLSSLGPHLIGVVAAVWLWRREHSSKRSQANWAIFGLAVSLWAVGMYLLIFALTPLDTPRKWQGDDPDART
jgi:hypothetical protein